MIIIRQTLRPLTSVWLIHSLPSRVTSSISALCAAAISASGASSFRRKLRMVSCGCITSSKSSLFSNHRAISPASIIAANDLEADEKIKVYDKGVKITSGQGVYDLLVSYRSGDVWSPKVEQAEALKVELGYFVECIRSGRNADNGGEAGLRVVKLLEAADQSLNARGKMIAV